MWKRQTAATNYLSASSCASSRLTARRPAPAGEQRARAASLDLDVDDVDVRLVDGAEGGDARVEAEGHRLRCVCV